MMEITANQLLGLSVFSLAKGERIGQVRSFLLDTKEKELLALIISNKKLLKDESVLCLADVVGLSLEAVTVDSPAVLRKKSDCPHLKELLKSPPDINGLAVLKKDGAFLGRAAAFYMEVETGKLTKIELSGGFFDNLRRGRSFLPMEDIEIIGSDIILAADDATVKTVTPEKREPQRTKRSVLRQKDKIEAGCKEKIMAFSDRSVEKGRRVIFPDIDEKAEDQKNV